MYQIELIFEQFNLSAKFFRPFTIYFFRKLFCFFLTKCFINFVLQERGQDCPEVWPEKEEDVGTMNDKRDICTKKIKY